MRHRVECPPPWHRGFNNADDMRNLRKLAGMSQATLGRLAGFDRHAVIYHEKRKGRIDGVAPRRFREAFEALGIKVPGWRQGPVIVPAGGGGFCQPLKGSTCGATTRKGTPCQCKALKRGGRCKFHGGMSTGPRTPEGKARIAAARRARAEREREAWQQPEAFRRNYALAQLGA